MDAPNATLRFYPCSGGDMQKFVTFILLLFTFQSFAFDLEYELKIATLDNDFKKVREVVEDGVDVNSWGLAVREGSRLSYISTPLHIAAERGYDQIVEYLLSKGAKSYSKNSYYSTPLHLAVRAGHLSTARILLNHDPSAVHVKSRDSQGMLHIAASAEKNSVKLLELLLNLNVLDPFELDNDSKSPLHSAMEADNSSSAQTLIGMYPSLGNPEKDSYSLFLASKLKDDSSSMVRFLLSKGHDVNQLGRKHFSKPYGEQLPLEGALLAGNYDSALLLLNAGANLKLFEKFERYSPVTYAAGAKENSLELLILLEKREDIEEVSFKRIQPLIFAAGAGNLESFRFLISKGANESMVGDGKDKVLKAAIESKSPEMVKYLFQNFDFDLEAKDENNQTPLHRALQFPYMQVEIVKMLLDRGADVNAVDRWGNGALHKAIQSYANLETIKRLIKAGANVNLKNNDGNSILHLLGDDYGSGDEEHTQNQDVVDFLLKNYPSDLEARNAEGETPLLRVARSSNWESVMSLVAAGADFKALDGKGNTILSALVRSYANENLAVPLFEFFLQQGVDPNVFSDDDERIKTLADQVIFRGDGNPEYLRLLYAHPDYDFPSVHSLLKTAIIRETGVAINWLASLGIDLDKVDEKGRSLLTFAVAERSWEILDRLMRLKVPLSLDTLEDISYQDPFYKLFKDDKTEILNRFIEYEYELTDGYLKLETTSLHLAAINDGYKSEELFLYLLESGVSPNATDKKLNTILHVLVSESKGNLARYLVKNYNVDVKAKNEDDLTPIEIAILNENFELAKFLLENKKPDPDPSVILNCVAGKYRQSFKFLDSKPASFKNFYGKEDPVHTKYDTFEAVDKDFDMLEFMENKPTNKKIKFKLVDGESNNPAQFYEFEFYDSIGLVHYREGGSEARRTSCD